MNKPHPHLFVVLLGSLLALSAVAEERRVPATELNPAVTIDVDASVERHPIDPRIYGVAWATEPAITDLGITLNRWGGNAMSRYNWEISTANRAKDWFFENQPDAVAGDGSNGESADDFIGPTLNAGADALMTIPVMGLLPKERSIICGYSVDKYGAQDAIDGDHEDCGNGKSGDNRLLHVNDPADTSDVYPSSHQGDWIQHLIATHGSAANGGVRYYALDNEPALWSFDHWDIHPDGSTYDEVWGKMEEYGAVIRAADPDAIITGLEEWGWSGYFMSGLDMENLDGADRAAHDGIGFAEWLLQQARAHEETTGVRILDVAALHFYPQNGEFSDDVSDGMQELRNRSTRSLWDPAYVDESWIGGTEEGGARVRLIPRLKEWTANNYPGTLTAITEYNWGAEGSMGGDSRINGGTAQADILGIFGREGLNIGVRWTTPQSQSHAYNAFKMYRNYDGNQSRFGDLSVSTTVPDPDQISAFSALRSSDRTMTIMIVAKNLVDSTPVTVNLANFAPSGAAERRQLDVANNITLLGSVAPAGSSLTLTVPAQSITLLVVPGTFVDAPASLVATATGASTASLSWPAVAGAGLYRVYRSSGHGPFDLVGSTGGTTFNDSLLSAGTTYLYGVRAVIGSAASGMSPVDPATTTVFTDPSLTVDATPVKALHMTQLRTAVNAMRVAAGLPEQVFPALAAGSTIKTTDIRDLRRALDPARAVIGVPMIAYTDRVLTPGVTRIKAVHVTDLRNGVK